MIGVFLLGLTVVLFGGLAVFIAFQRVRLFQQCRRIVPDLSLLLIVHNQAPILEGAIKGLLSYYQSAQRSFEMVVYDNGSTDETAEILRCLARKHNFALLRGKKPQSFQAVMDICLEACRGKIVHYFLLTEQVELRTVTSLARCLSRGERIPDFGIACTPGVRSGTKTRSNKNENNPFIGMTV